MKQSCKILFKIKKYFINLLRFVLIFGISFIILYPLITKLSVSIMPESDFYNPTVGWIPTKVTLNHYITVWRNMNYPVAFFNTFVLSLSVSILQLIACTIVGYGLARFQFKAKGIIFFSIIFTLVVPPQMISTPLYLNFRFFDFFGLFPNSINLINSYWPFLLTSLTATGFQNGLFIYIMRQFFLGMPKNLEEAAYIDGAGLFKTFYRVMLPGAKAALLVVFLFAFVWQYNDYFFTMLYLENGNYLPQALASLIHSLTLAYESQGMNVGNPNNFFGEHYLSILNNTGMLLVISPLLIMYSFLQRFFIESIERTGLVG